MKNMLMIFAAPVALLSMSMAQTTPAPLAMTSTSASIKGCLGGSDGAFSVAQDGSAQTYKITSSSVDLKPHVGHEVELTGQKSSAAVFGAAETVSVTGVTMIAEHCPAAAASTATPAADPATATLSAPAATAAASTPAVAAAAVPAPATTATTTTTTTTAVEPVAVTKAAETASAPAAPVVLASATTPLPNNAPAALKPVKVTGKIGDDGKTFVGDKDSKSWTVTNPEAVKGHEGHHVTLTAHLDATKSEVEVVSLKMAK